MEEAVGLQVGGGGRVNGWVGVGGGGRGTGAELRSTVRRVELGTDIYLSRKEL